VKKKRALMTSGAKALIGNRGMIAALKRCATQNRVLQQTVKACPFKPIQTSPLGHYSGTHAAGAKNATIEMAVENLQFT
jgi:hypothetical protein